MVHFVTLVHETYNSWCPEYSMVHTVILQYLWDLIKTLFQNYEHIAKFELCQSASYWVLHSCLPNYSGIPVYYQIIVSAYLNYQILWEELLFHTLRALKQQPRRETKMKFYEVSHILMEVKHVFKRTNLLVQFMQWKLQFW
jgi:hypothetical protein